MEHLDEYIYCSVGHRVIYGDARSYVYLPASSALAAMGAHDLALLSACATPRTLRAHAAAITSANPALVPLVSGRLEELIRQQLLVKVDGDGAACERQRPGARLETIGIPTADRPTMLDRCLRSISAASSGCPFRVVVVDGSRSDSNRAENREIVTAIQASSPWLTVEYAGRAEASAFLDSLLAPADRAALESVLLPGSIGANRNLLLLMAAGAPIAMIDDDIILRPVCLSQAADSSVSLSGCNDTRRALFCRGRADAIDAASAREANIFRAFESLLGITLSQAAQSRSRARGSEPCSHFQRALAENPGDYTCRVVYAGIAGDCATSAPVFAWGTEAMRAAFMADPAQFPTALESPNGVRVVDRAALTHGLGCMAYCMAVDNSELLPPFLPWVRNEDGVFGAMIETLDPTAMSADLPWAVVHDSLRQNGRVAFEEAWRPGVGDMVIKLLGMVAGASRFGTLAEKMAGVGHAFLHLADASDSEVKDCFVDLSLSRLRHYLSRISAWQNVFAASGVSADDLRDRVIRSSRDSFTSPPRDLVHSPFDNSWEGLRHLLRDFGYLLVCWPSLWSSAQAVREQVLVNATAR